MQMQSQKGHGVIAIPRAAPPEERLLCVFDDRIQFHAAPTVRIASDEPVV